MKDWLDDIQDKLGDFEMKAPEGLWARIETSGAAREDVAQAAEAHPGKTVVPVWGRWISMAGAVAAAVLAAAFLFRDGTDGQPGNMVPGSVVPAEMTVLADNPDLTDTDDVQERQAPAGLQATAYLPAPESGTGTGAGTIVPDTGSMTLDAETMVPECEDISSYREEKVPEKQEAGSTPGEWERFLEPERTRSRGTMGIGIRGSYGSGRSDLLAMAGSLMAAAGPGDNVAWEESPALGMMLFNRGGGQAEYTHRMPVRFGLMLDWQLGGRWSIESGVSFTRLNSIVRQGDDRNYTRTMQKLDYIGIPLDLRYMAFETERVGVYASAGVGIDKCVSARSTGSYSFTGMAGTEKGSLGTERYSERPLQFMVNAAVGADWLITPGMSLYAEPGLAWYADDGSPFDTIYKERPVNFRMDFGLRLRLGGR